MVTLKQIQKRYKKRLPKRFVVDISKYIDQDDPQEFIKKALAYKLADSDYKTLFSIGRHKSKQYPKLYYLCCIYIHPLTIVQHACKVVIG